MTARSVRIGESLAALGYRAAWATAPLVSNRAGLAALNRVADTLVDRRGPSVVQLARNLRRVLGSGATPSALHAVTQAGMRSYGRYWWETFRLHRMDLLSVTQQGLASTVGTDNIVSARDAGRGIIVALPHSGNWDVAGLSLGSLTGGITAVAERLRPESLYRRFMSYREGLGFEILPLESDARGSANTAGVLRQRLREGRMVCLVADRDIAGNGVPVTFFGERTTMPAGPAMLAARTGAALLPAHLAYTDDGWIQTIGAPLEFSGDRLVDRVRNGTQMLANFFEEHIAMFPADWHMLQPFWEEDRQSRGSVGDQSGHGEVGSEGEATSR